MLSKFLDPKNDVAFRKIFGTEKKKIKISLSIFSVMTSPLRMAD